MTDRSQPPLLFSWSALVRTAHRVLGRLGLRRGASAVSARDADLVAAALEDLTSVLVSQRVMNEEQLRINAVLISGQQRLHRALATLKAQAPTPDSPEIH